jgi:hypothetical protein
LPPSWVLPLNISPKGLIHIQSLNSILLTILVDFQKRHPNFRKTFFYKKTRVEKYAPYSMKDGIILKVSEFADYDCKFHFDQNRLFFLFRTSSSVKELIYVTQRYQHRHDKLEAREHDVKTNTVYENYLPGRLDHLKGKMKMYKIECID